MGSGDTKWNNTIATDARLNAMTHLAGTTSERTASTAWPTTMPWYDTDLKKWYKNTGSEGTPTSVEIGAEGSAYDIVYPLSTTIGDYTLTPAAATATSNGTIPNSTLHSLTSQDDQIQCANGGDTRIAQKFATGHALIGQTVTGCILKLKKLGSPTGTATIRIRNSGDTIVDTLGTIDVSTLTTSFVDYPFTSGAGRVIANGDRICFEYSGGTYSTHSAILGYNTTSTEANTQLSTYNGSWTDTAYELYIIVTGDGTASAASTYDGSTSTYWKSNSEASPAIYWDFTSNRKFIAFALNLNTTDTTVSTIELSLSTDTTFSGEVKRTLLESDFTNNTWRYILINIQATDTRYVQLKGSGTGVLSVYEFKARATTDTSPGFGHYHKVISTSATSASSNDSN